MEKKLKVGQTVFVKPIGNEARHSEVIREQKITKVGNKFFEIDGGRFTRSRFFIEDLRQDGRGYSANFQIYLSKESIEDEKEFNKLLVEVRGFFYISYGKLKLSLDQLRKIHSIIYPENQSNHEKI